MPSPSRARYVAAMGAEGLACIWVLRVMHGGGGRRPHGQWGEQGALGREGVLTLAQGRRGASGRVGGGPR